MQHDYFKEQSTEEVKLWTWLGPIHLTITSNIWVIIDYITAVQILISRICFIVKW